MTFENFLARTLRRTGLDPTRFPPFERYDKGFRLDWVFSTKAVLALGAKNATSCLERLLFGMLRSRPLANRNGKDINSDWLTDQWDEQSVLGHVQIHKGNMSDDDRAIATAQNPKQLDGGVALLEKIRKTFTDSIPQKFEIIPFRMKHVRVLP